MKFALIVGGALVLFAVASVALWRTVGGLVEQAGAREAEKVAIDVRFALTDREGRPLANAPVRLLPGGDVSHQLPEAGERFVTDASGVTTLTTTATLDKVQKKRPTNFVSSLFSNPELTDHMSLGVELGYMTYHWLYVADLYRFPDGDVLHDGLTLYTRDEQGRYSRPAEPDGGGWKIADLGSMRLTSLGYDFTLLAFERKPDAAGWHLSIVFARQPEPVTR